MRKVLALCDGEQLYTTRFLEYLCRWKDLPFDVKIFSSAEKLAEYARDSRIEVLLIAENALTDTAREIPAGRRILLAEERGSGKESPSIYKYQAAGRVVREVMDLYGAQLEAEQADPGQDSGSSRILGVLSLKDSVGRTAFAVTAGRIMAEQQRVLYLPLERYSGIERMLKCEGYGTVSDLLYYFRQNRSGLAYRLEGMLQRMGGLLFVSPADNPEDYLETGPEEWAELMAAVGHTGRFDVIVLDIGCELPDITPLLTLCEQVWMISSKDALAQGKEESFLDWVSARDPSAASLIRRVEWTCPVIPGDMPDYFGEILNSRAGEQVRRELDGAGI